ncbi:DUF6531 domain-containing protein [Jiangella mangrovi]|uniref:RHS repeat-associated protein n=1 Tax=Jiangella mangrovi TaxID=1524084 RepID=A0A7W9GRT4_9ACTN|nr:DUF6531 domain-containing protein [Jiangella mangrovi]MBB5788752.1 RHS repeat-associated protein [Jiangella mangrovi]
MAPELPDSVQGHDAMSEADRDAQLDEHAEGIELDPHRKLPVDDKSLDEVLAELKVSPRRANQLVNAVGLPRNVQGFNSFGGALAASGAVTQYGSVLPGEPVTFTFQVQHSGPAGTVEDVAVSANTRNCLLQQQVYSLGTVSAPSINDGVPGVPVTFTVALPGTGCTGTWNNPLRSNSSVFVNAAVVGGQTGSSTWNLWVNGDIPDGLIGGLCAPTSAGRGGLQNSGGNSVNTATGAFTPSFTDVELAAPGETCSATRTYSSRDTDAGSMGVGWSVPWEARLQIASGGASVVLHAEDGSAQPFTRRSNGTYASPITSRSTLMAVTGGYQLRTPDGTVLAFDTAGTLTSTVAATGQGLSLQHSSGKVSTITDAAGHTFDLTYTGGLLTQIDISDGREITYGYTSGRLTSVTGVDGTTSTYGYDTNGRLSVITDATGADTVTNVYDAQGRVSTQTDALDRETTFEHEQYSTDVTDPEGGIWTDVYAGKALVGRFDPLGNLTQSRYDVFWNPSQVRDPSGGTTSFTYDTAHRVTTETGPAPSSLTQSWVYDTNGDATSHTGPHGAVTGYTYNAARLPLTVTTDDGAVTTNTYDTRGLLETATTPEGHTTEYDYDTAGNLVTETSPTGAVTTYGYDTSGRMTSRVDPRGNEPGADPADFTTTYTYDDADRLLTQTTPDGAVTQYAYDDAGRLVEITDPAGEITTNVYDGAGQLTTTTAPDGGVTTHTYDDAGNQTSITDPNGDVTTLEYDAANRLVARTSPRGNEAGGDPADFTTTFGYDERGFQVSLTDPMGAVEVTEYDELGRRVSVTDELGRESTWSYDGAGRTLTATDPGGRVTTTDYDEVGRPIAVIDPADGVTTSTYDDDGNRLTETTPGGITVTRTYDDDGRVSTLTDGRGEITTYGYDAAGGLITETNPSGETTTTSYDALNRIATVTDALSRTTSYTYTPAGQVDTVTDPTGAVTTYTYDPVGRVATITDANSHTTSYDYDLAGRQTSVTDGLNRVASYDYDADGNRTGITNARGQTVTTVYDARGLKTSVAIPGATTVTYGYDDAGQLTSVTDATGTRQLTYDDAGQMTSVGTAATGFDYTYDDLGNVASITYPGGTQVVSTYDADSLLATRTINGQASSFTYDNAGNPLTATLPGGTTEERGYDDAGRLTSVRSERSTGALISSWTYTLDDAGQPTRIDTTRGTAAPTRTTIEYDDAGRPTRECTVPATSTCTATGGTRYDYDDVGNRTRVRTATTDLTHAYDAANQITATIQTATGTPVQSYTHDLDGNLITDGATTYTFDAANRLTAVDTATTDAVYGYDGFGLRTSSTTGTAITRSTWDINADVPYRTETITPAGATTAYVTDPTGAILAQRTAAGVFPHLHDRLGSTTEVVNTTGAQQWRYTYDVFGVTTTTQVATSPPANTGRYTGAHQDTATADYHLLARDYQPDTGRFTSTDPVDRPAGSSAISPYIYADGQPTTLTDPTGLCPLCVIAAVGGAIGGLAGGVSYAFDHEGDWDWSDFGTQVFQDAAIGAGAAILMPGVGNAVASTVRSGAPRFLTALGVNTAVGAGYTWATNTLLCRPTSALDVALGAIGGGLSSAVPAFLSRSSLPGANRSAGPLGPGAGAVAGLTDEQIQLATQHVTNSGDTVLGRHPGYINKAEARGASYFDIGKQKWDEYTAQGFDPWALNVYFLDDRIAAGDRILLSVPKGEIPLGGYLQREIDYLLANGYQWVNQWSLRPRG